MVFDSRNKNAPRRNKMSSNRNIEKGSFSGQRNFGPSNNRLNQNQKSKDLNLQNKYSRSRFTGVYKKKYDNDPEEFWYKVIISQGAKSTKEHIFNAIREITGTSIISYNYHVEGNCVIFFIQGSSAVDCVKACSRRIYDKRGQTLHINVIKSHLSNPIMDKNIQDIILEAMKLKYNQNMNFLNLSNFSQTLQEMSIFISLSKNSFLTLVVKKIKELFPNTVFLSLAENAITSLEPLSTLQNVKSLKALDLSNNFIQKLEDLMAIKQIELEELVLTGNPVYISHQNSNSSDIYISWIRSRFPKLLKLDEKAFSPSIKFDVGEASTLPPSLGSFVPPDIKNFVAEFLQQYFSIYDSENRQPLIAAYHDQAIFSYGLKRTHAKSQVFLQSLITNSRNLLKVKDGGVRIKLLHHGGIAVVAALNEMPRTKHIASSFIVDVPFHDNNFYSIVVNGVYKEFTKKQVYTRAFSRNFLIIPHNQGFVIINDILLLTNATVEQIQKYSRLVEKYTILEKIKEETFLVPNFSTLSLGEKSFAMNDIDRETIITQFCNATRMNRAFSTQCLEENGYDANKALNVFNQLNQNSAIPPEAFIQ